MLWAILAISSHLVFIPGLYDGHTPVKTVFVIGLGLMAWIHCMVSFSNKTMLIGYTDISKNETLIYSAIFIYLLLSNLGIYGVINWNLFIDRIALEIACFGIFLAIASSSITTKKLTAIGSTAFVIFLLLIVSTGISWFNHLAFTIDVGAMGNTAFMSIAVAQLLPLAAMSAFCLGSYVWLIAILILMIPFLNNSTAALIGGGGAFLIILSYMFWRNGRVLSQYLVLSFIICLPVIFLCVVLFGLHLQSGLQHRSITWRNSLEMVKAHPLGIGIGQFEIKYPKYANSIHRDKEMHVQYDVHRKQVVRDPHNDLLLRLVERGIAGVIAWLALLFLIVYRPIDYDSIEGCLATALLVTLAIGVLYFPLSHPSMAATFWASAGLYWSYNKSWVNTESALSLHL
jgi:O-antigen ligase|tara:strand:+ start:797 stop:1996 length:1200 start_codon:yes stop_codon:yes gene_type:complete